MRRLAEGALRLFSLLTSAAMRCWKFIREALPIAGVARRASASDLGWEDADGPDATERGMRIGESSDDRELEEDGLGGLTRRTKEVLAREG